MSAVVQEQDSNSNSRVSPHRFQPTRVCIHSKERCGRDPEDQSGDGYYMDKLGQYYRPSELPLYVWSLVSIRLFF